MAGSVRNSAQVVAWLHQLEAEPYRFGFLPVMRRLEAAYADKPRLGEALRASEDPVRLGQSPSLAFAPSSIAAFKTGTTTRPDYLESYFFGLFGPNGPMPLHISEYAYGREINDGDRTFRAFADMFHHRLLSLFYRASVNGEPTFNMDRPTENDFDLYVGALLGVGPKAFRDRDAMQDAAKLHSVARLSLQTRPAEGLAALLEQYFELPFVVEELIGEWLEIAEDDRLCLGRSKQACQLGITTIIGDEIWNCQHKFRVVCGPLSLKNFEHLLPGADSQDALNALVRNYSGDEFAWDLKLILKQAEVPSIRLGSNGNLGWTSWLGSRTGDSDADDVVVNLQRLLFAEPAH